MIPEIERKIEDLINGGITAECHVVYLLAEIRKIMEQDQTKKNYKYLNFHCNWALHSKLDGGDAQEILKIFDAVHNFYQEHEDGEDLPQGLDSDLERIAKMTFFRDELTRFLIERGLPIISQHSANGWAHFQHLYAKVIEDCPLVIKENNREANIEKVTVNIEFATKVVAGWVNYRVVWVVLDKTGRSYIQEVYNSFSLN